MGTVGRKCPDILLKINRFIHQSLYTMKTENAPITVQVLQEKPTGILIRLVMSNKEITVPTSVFWRRVELGVYRVENPEVLSSSIAV